MGDAILKVLVVEDSKATRTLLASTLEALGAVEVVTAISGFEALKVLPRHQFALIITDINMPDINGLELLSFIRQSERHRATPVLLMSTQTSGRDRERGLALGAVGYLSKPFTPEQLRDEALRHLSAAPDERGHG